jgi:hypothetical protein
LASIKSGARCSAGFRRRLWPSWVTRVGLIRRRRPRHVRFAPIADVRRDDAWLGASFQFSINNTSMVWSDSAVDQRFTQTRRASDTKAATRHLPHGSGDVGLHEAAGPVHEVQERLVLHPRGDRPDAEARGRAAVRVDRRSAAKKVMDSGPGNLRRSSMAVASPSDLWCPSVRRKARRAR